MNSHKVTLTIPDAKSVLSIVHKFGFACIPNFVNTQELGRIKFEFEEGLVFNNYTYGYGQAARFVDTLPNNLIYIRQFFERAFFQQVLNNFWDNDLIELEYAFVHDFKYDENTIYGKLHYDRRHQLKFMLYLTDVLSKSHGAFSAIPGSVIIGKELYANSWKKALVLSTDDYKEIDKSARLVSDSDPRYKALPFRIIEDKLPIEEYQINESCSLIGTAGTLIVFDTHTLHFGGLVSDNLERKVLKLHSYPKGWILVIYIISTLAL